MKSVMSDDLYIIAVIFQQLTDFKRTIQKIWLEHWEFGSSA